jgi:hypothetical protein
MDKIPEDINNFYDLEKSEEKEEYNGKKIHLNYFSNKIF